jgi:hypothetical protein
MSGGDSMRRVNLEVSELWISVTTAVLGDRKALFQVVLRGRGGCRGFAAEANCSLHVSHTSRVANSNRKSWDQLTKGISQSPWAVKRFTI